MHTITKQDVSNLVLLEYSSQCQVYQEKIQFFEKKYNSTFIEFEQKINNSANDNFGAWDDLIEWEADTNFLKEITLKIEDIKYGHFQVA